LDTAPPPLVEEDLEEEEPSDPLEDLGATLSARPFHYLYRHTATVALAAHWTLVSPELSFEATRVVYAAVEPGGPTLVCVQGEICWRFEGEMERLWVPEKLNARGYPYLYLVAVMPGGGRVDLWQPVDGDQTRPEPTSDPSRTVEIFEPDAAPASARAWVDFLDPIDDAVEIVSGAQPIPHVFVGQEETGQLCISRVDRFRCSEPVSTGAKELTVSYSPETIDFGPELGFARLPQGKDDIFPLLQLWREWEVTGTPPLDPDCFTIRRADGAYATRVVGIGDMETPIEKKAKIPKFSRPRLVPTDATAAELVTGWDFAGSWGVGEAGGLERRKRCK
jgi:hypothetical protein